jgi:hypothetical protein
MSHVKCRNDAAEIKLRAERRAGEMLKEGAENGDRAKPGNPQWSQAETIAPVKLAEIGINKTQSSRWQCIASIPEEKFEQRIRETKAKPGAELTTQAVLRVAKRAETGRAALKDISFRLPGLSFKSYVRGDAVWVLMMKANSGTQETIASAKAKLSILDDAMRMSREAFRARLEKFLRENQFEI